MHLSVSNILPFILQESCVSISVGYAFWFLQGIILKNVDLVEIAGGVCAEEHFAFQ